MVIEIGAVSNIKFLTGCALVKIALKTVNSAQTCYTLASYEYQSFDSRKTKNGNVNQCVIYVHPQNVVNKNVSGFNTNTYSP